MKPVLTLFLFSVLATQLGQAQNLFWIRDSTTFPTLVPNVNGDEKPIDYDAGWLAFQTNTNNVVEIHSYDATNDFQKWGELTSPNPAHTDFGKAIAIDETHLAISSGDVVYAYEYDGANWELVNTLTTPTEVADNNGFKPNDRLELDHDLLVVASPNWMTAKSTETPYVSFYSWNTNTWDYEDSYPMTFINKDSLFFPGDFCECVSWPGTIGSHCDLTYVKGGTIAISDNHIFAGNATLNALPLIISNNSGTWQARIPHLDFLRDDQDELFVELTDSVLQEVYALHPQMHLCAGYRNARGLINTARTAQLVGDSLYFWADAGGSIGSPASYNVANDVGDFYGSNLNLTPLHHTHITYLENKIVSAVDDFSSNCNSGLCLKLERYNSNQPSSPTLIDDYPILNFDPFGDAHWIEIDQDIVLRTSGYLLRLDALASREVSLDELVRISPNPANDRLTISIAQNSPVDINIVSVTGQRLLSKQLPKNDSQHQLDISHLPAGVYVVKVQGEQGQFMTRLVKE